MALPPLTPVRWTRTSRLIPTRYPSVGLFERIAQPDDLDAVLELETWTNDRVNNELGLLHRIGRDDWVVGQPMASVVMAAFCHPHPDGSRFAGAERGAWYCGRTLDTALAESVFHRTRELTEVGFYETVMQMRLYHADFRSEFHDVRAETKEFDALHRPDTYQASQAFGQTLLEMGSAGVVYRSVRHSGGECLACFRPKLVLNVRVAAHYEYRWEGTPAPRVLRLPARKSRSDIPNAGDAAT